MAQEMKKMKSDFETQLQLINKTLNTLTSRLTLDSTVQNQINKDSKDGKSVSDFFHSSHQKNGAKSESPNENQDEPKIEEEKKEESEDKEQS